MAVCTTGAAKMPEATLRRGHAWRQSVQHCNVQRWDDLRWPHLMRGVELTEFAAPPSGLSLSADLRATIIAHLRDHLPHEAVGLLAIESGPGSGNGRAVAFYPGTNIDASPTRYTMEPAEVIAALQDIERNGWRLGAIVHSHPATPAVPSETDLREANYPESLLVIVTWHDDRAEMRAWQIVAGADVEARAIEVPVVVAGGGGRG